MNDQKLVERFRKARRDNGLVLLEGLHALKHANRFGAELLEVVAAQPDNLRELAAQLAPDVLPMLEQRLQAVSPKVFADLAPIPPPTGVLALAKRPNPDPAILTHRQRQPIVLLAYPQRYGNVGAVIRVSAAANAAAFVLLGGLDPWHPEAVRGAAGLQFALPLFHVSKPPRFAGPLVAVHPEGQSLDEVEIPAGAVLTFGSERLGLRSEMLERADLTVRIPMRPGVSSLNLATSVAAVLYRQPGA